MIPVAETLTNANAVGFAQNRWKFYKKNESQLTSTGETVYAIIKTLAKDRHSQK